MVLMGTLNHIKSLDKRNRKVQRCAAVLQATSRCSVGTILKVLQAAICYRRALHVHTHARYMGHASCASDEAVNPNKVKLRNASTTARIQTC